MPVEMSGHSLGLSEVGFVQLPEANTAGRLFDGSVILQRLAFVMSLGLSLIAKQIDSLLLVTGHFIVFSDVES